MIPVPQGLEIPDADTFDFVTTYRLEGDQLVPVAVDGIALDESQPAAAPAAGGNENFLSAIERAMSNQ